MSDNLGTGKISSLFMKMVIPSVISQLVVLIYNMVDRIFIGHIPDIGSTALTGVGICMPVTLIVSAFAQLTGVGGAPLASMALGRNDKEEAERILGTCCFGMIVVSVLLTITGLVFSEKILFFFGASSNTIFYAREYLNIYLAGTIFVELTIGLTAFITAQGFTAVTMVSVTTGAILNVFLDPLLIFGFNMGVKGAAIASVFSQMVSVFIALLFLVRHENSVKMRMKYIRFDRKRNIRIHEIRIVSLYYGCDRKFCFYRFQSFLITVWRRSGSGKYDYFFNYYADGYHAIAGIFTGSAAYHKL